MPPDIAKRVEFRHIAGLDLLWLKDKSKEKIEKAWKYFQDEEHQKFPQIIMDEYCKSFRTIIQAGGHCGLYPIQYSKRFETVYTFEPTYINHYCLRENTKDYENIIVHNNGLGEIEKKVLFNVSRKNSGGHHVNPEESDTGNISIKTIDSYNVIDCDLIHLDIEGYELFALKGAVNTIKSSKPMIVLETTDALERYNCTKEDILNFLSQFGYKVVKEWDRDTLYAVV